jgi:hypothetical protein
MARENITAPGARPSPVDPAGLCCEPRTPQTVRARVAAARHPGARRHPRIHPGEHRMSEAIEGARDLLRAGFAGRSGST